MEQRFWPRSHEELNQQHIQVRVATVEHVFNSMDPAPISERSLNPEVADWIEEWAEDIDKDQPLTVEFYVAEGRGTWADAVVSSALHHHFECREWQASRQLSKLWREGRLSLVIGLFAIAGFTAASHAIGTSANPVVEVIHEGLAVVGWVSMWKPLDIFLYAWWPIRRERRACRRLAEATVTFPLATR